MTARTGAPLALSNDALARQLRIVAGMIAAGPAMGMKRQVFMVRVGGVDSHSFQMGDQPLLMGRVAHAVDWFLRALLAHGPLNRPVQITVSICEIACQLVSNVACNSRLVCKLLILPIGDRGPREQQMSGERASAIRLPARMRAEVGFDKTPDAGSVTCSRHQWHLAFQLPPHQQPQTIFQYTARWPLRKTQLQPRTTPPAVRRRNPKDVCACGLAGPATMSETLGDSAPLRHRLPSIPHATRARTSAAPTPDDARPMN